MKNKIGRPRLSLNVIPRGRFTVEQAHNANPYIEARLTVYKCIKRLLKAGKLSKLREKKEHAGPGRPSWIFVRKASKKAPASAPVPSVNLTTPAPEPVIAPAPEVVTA